MRASRACPFLLRLKVSGFAGRAATARPSRALGVLEFVETVARPLEAEQALYLGPHGEAENDEDEDEQRQRDREAQAG
jgi:hypothetical protein